MSDDSPKSDIQVQHGPARKSKQKSRESVPRKEHGTRVSFSFQCSDCGSDAELDYVPKNKSPDELLCEECLRDLKGDESNWAKTRRQKERETRDEWPIDCAECGRMDYIPFEPEAEKDYYCYRCFNQDPDEPDAEGKSDSNRVYIRFSEET